MLLRRRPLTWHRWFAWYPVPVGNGMQLVWLETVRRKFSSGPLTGRVFVDHERIEETT